MKADHIFAWQNGALIDRHFLSARKSSAVQFERGQNTQFLKP